MRGQVFIFHIPFSAFIHFAFTIFHLLNFNNETMKQFTICILLYIICIDIFYENIYI